MSVCETQIQFHPDQINFLVVHHSHLAIYELATELKCVNQVLYFHCWFCGGNYRNRGEKRDNTYAEEIELFYSNSNCSQQ